MTEPGDIYVRIGPRVDPAAFRAEDHDVPYAPVPAAAFKLAAVIPVSSELWADADVYGGRPDGMWRAYWRRREFNELRHPNPFPRFRPFRWLP